MRNYIQPDYRNMQIGDEYFIARKGRLYGPRKVIKITKTQFTLSDDENEATLGESKGGRFMLATGNQVGWGWRSYAKKATPDVVKDANEIRTTEARAKAEKKALAEAEEEALRKSYDAADITNEVIHERWLKPLRYAAETARKEAEKQAKYLENTTRQIECFNIKHKVECIGDAAEELVVANYMYTCALDLHTEIVTKLRKFYDGTRFVIRGLSGTLESEEIMADHVLANYLVSYCLSRAMDAFFHGHVRNEDIRMRRAFITTLRDIQNAPYSYPRVVEVKSEEAA